MARDSTRLQWRLTGVVLGCSMIAATAWYLFSALDTLNLLSGDAGALHGSQKGHGNATNAGTSSPIHTGIDFTNVDRLIVAAHYHEDVEWTKYIVDIPVKLVEKDNPNNPDNVGSNNMTESTSYLYYMIKYYDMLPDVVAFIHGHGDPQVLDDSVWTVKEYQAIPHPETMETCNTRHETEGGHLVWLGEAEPVPKWPGDPMKGIKDTQYQRAYHTLWNWLKLDWSEGGLGLQVPHYVSTQCCSAFSVDRDTIRGVPKERLIRLFDYLESGINIDMGVPMEYVWILLFNQKVWD